jgi:flagellar hook protein FlgE
MSAAFSIALSALSADTTAINVVGNNLANLNTNGYKTTVVNFEDLMSLSLNTGSSPEQVGMGVAPPVTLASYTQGTITNTSGPMDAAVQGQGFFVVQNAAAQTLYTRDGAFHVDGSGNVVTATGENLQGWSAVNGAVNASGAVGNLSVPLGTVVPAIATTKMNVTANLDASTATNGSFSAPAQVYDSLGTAHTLTVNFTETAANSWNYTVTLPASDLGSGGDPKIASGTLSFDSNGKLTSPAASDDPVALKITGLADGASDMNIGWNMYNGTTPSITQFAEASSEGAVTQDGQAAGQISGLSLQNGGLLVATFSNGKQTTVGQVALASVPNPESLVSVGNNNLQASASTGSIAVGAANTGGRGQIVAQSLEGSTVDMATQFTDMLSYERSYQAASRVITTSDQMLQDVENLVHP